MIPTLTGARILLRPFAEADRPAALVLLGDEAFMAWSSSGPLQSDAAATRFAKLVETPEITGFGKFAVVTKEDRDLIGYCGIEPALVEGRPEQELGFRIAAGARGRGYAAEAAGLAIDDYFARSGAGYLLAYAEPGNGPSLHLIGKLGFRFLRAVDHNGLDYRLFRLDRPAPEAGPGSLP